MTEPERRHLRQLIDQARRQRLRHGQMQLFDPADGYRACAYCGEPFEVPAGPNGRRKRFCRTTHKANWFRRERMRRERAARVAA